MEELTRKQQAVYNYICDHICEHHRPPTRHEISVAMNFASPNSANEYVAILVRKGYITLLDGDRNLKLKNKKLKVVSNDRKKRLKSSALIVDAPAIVTPVGW